MARKKTALPITHWSYSSLMSYLRNPLAWYKRYVEHVYDTPSSPAGIIGRAGHVALQHFYSGIAKEGAIDLGLEYLRSVPDFEINFGKLKSLPAGRQGAAQRRKRQLMGREYLQAVAFYLEKPPRYDVLGVEVRADALVQGLPLPIRAVSDLVVRSKGERDALDVVDHKFVDSFSALGAGKTLFVIQAIFNYYTVSQMYDRPVRRFILQECKKRKNADGSPQMRKYVINFDERAEDFALFHRLIKETTADLAKRQHFLPNPSDMFEGENSFDIYRLGLTGKNHTL
ncbi:MAG TPA: PD-(D/E)XK nuclease family protein [Candidatus Paceibacterota bacterium]